MTLGSNTQLLDMIAQDPACKLAAELYDFYYAASVTTWEKSPGLVGTGACVALVEAATGCPGPASLYWRQGPVVKGNAKIPPGTGIATFDENGRYASAATGNHAAIFVAVSAAGIVVVDQWVGKTKPAAPSRRTIAFRGGVGSASNDGDRFWVIVTAKIVNHPDKGGC